MQTRSHVELDLLEINSRVVQGHISVPTRLRRGQSPEATTAMID